ncbi:minichromosome maintenance protein MCM [Haloferax mediterranei ATCC 33500]|uniref:DNA helicase n=1 Tax=Haloferax mediterranei (strain ATCC 33500 / DSM 1411 / JCM 8866 / NBRC 14739 / NCIMB 2177 / R-4) TaxID=523841 RepID=I3R331_HALMT|nr:minichromosome maintenance protein MCM [Haloferax mediterranei]AFK18641.1 replicative DNA helicase / cell division control protein 21 /MCM [Haloferax mediterranei ATCC 33500]AHZ21986.1 DNA helicase [Haloferax mediterranei ATCC 33500]EMA02082.1 replicative DNA helicase / cell division control protein 21 /MCM [Haloferax mediterranei ATCC 33500]MDX5988735.1 minichromosome maintenance protein MCM [Haloferax mediterranei ATCC 33500]QCQ75142.1 minichromosome maintenance protein MCM [Haloferax med
MSYEDRLAEIVEEVAHNDIYQLSKAYPDETRLGIDWQDIARFEADVDGTEELTLSDVSGVASDVISRPETTLEALEAVVREFDVPGREKPMARTSVSVVNLPEDATYDVGGFSPEDWIGRMLALEGQITKRTEVNPLVKEAAFECLRCGTMTYIPQHGFGSLREPHKCQGCDLQGPFRLNETQSQWTNYQKIRLQEPPENARGETEHIDIHLTGDLAGDTRVEGGTRTTFFGRLNPVYTGDVVFEKDLVGTGYTVEQGGFEDADLSEYEDIIDEVASAPDTFDILVDSFAPSHQGHWHVKEALVLQLFGGWARTGEDGTRHRGDSHMFLLGDPGTGKTLLLEAAYEIAPRGALTDGTGSSSAGLTASIVKDSFSSEQFSIEAGTLVRANKGLAVVDELDKGDTSDLDALHTALESQQVHVSKAGKNASLPAETALLAAGNPTGGHFDPSKDIAEQVELKSPLLSRFDLIFTVRSEEDEDKIRDISDTMVSSRQRAGRRAVGDEVEPDASGPSVRLDRDEFTAYVTAAKAIRPVVHDPEVEREMREWFVETKTSLPERYASEMGHSEYDGPPLPITARKLDALQRLAEASARMRMSETVEMCDVERAKPLIERSLADIGIAPADSSSFSRSEAEATEIGL